MERYALIRTHMPREFVLLQGTGCRWKRCTFCDYHTDTSENPYATNAPILEMVTGEMGVLDIINSGSGIELDEQTLEHIARVVRKKQIHTLWFEIELECELRLLVSGVVSVKNAVSNCLVNLLDNKTKKLTSGYLITSLNSSVELLNGGLELALNHLILKCLCLVYKNTLLSGLDVCHLKSPL